MSDLLHELEHIASEDSQQDWMRLEYGEIHRKAFIRGGEYIASQAADTIEQQQKRIAELEHRVEEAEGKLSVVLDRHGQPDSYKCVSYDLTPLETEKKLQDSIKRLGWLPPDEVAALRQERDELAAAVDVLREYLRSLVEESTGVVGWHLNGAVADWDEIGATDILGETPQQSLNVVKREAFIDGFMFSGEGFNGELYSDGWSKVVELFDAELQAKYPSVKDGE